MHASCLVRHVPHRAGLGGFSLQSKLAERFPAAQTRTAASCTTKPLFFVGAVVTLLFGLTKCTPKEMAVGWILLALRWVPVSDQWQISQAEMRGLRLQDVRQMTENEKRLARLFGG